MHMHVEDFGDFEALRPLGVGDAVPDFSFQVYHRDSIQDSSMKAFRGKWLVLFFYPADFTFVCPTELGELANLYPEFQKQGVEVASVSTDSAFTHKMWHETSETIKKIEFPMISDHRHEMAETFGVLCEEDGFSYRATVIVDPEGVIRSLSVNDNSFGRSSQDILRMVKAAKFVSEHKGQVCPASWNEGDDTLTPADGLVGKL